MPFRVDLPREMQVDHLDWAGLPEVSRNPKDYENSSTRESLGGWPPRVDRRPGFLRGSVAVKYRFVGPTVAGI